MMSAENESGKGKNLVQIIGIVLLFLIFGRLLFPPSPEPEPKSLNKVLIVRVISDKNDSSGIASFEKAFRQGGEVAITTKEIMGKFPNFEKKYAIVNARGSYFPRGALINLIADKGWKFHSHGNPLNAIWFTKEIQNAK